MVWPLISFSSWVMHGVWEVKRCAYREVILQSLLSPFLLPWQGLLVTVNGNPVDYHTIHPSLPIENGPAKTDLYTTPQYRWEPSEESSGNASQ